MITEKDVHEALDTAQENGYDMTSGFAITEIIDDLVTYNADFESVEYKDIEPHVKTWLTKKTGRTTFD